MADWTKATTHLSHGAYRCFICADNIEYGDHFKNLMNGIRAHLGCAKRAMKMFPPKRFA